MLKARVLNISSHFQAGKARLRAYPWSEVPFRPASLLRCRTNWSCKSFIKL